jgi:hypothetical protein
VPATDYGVGICRPGIVLVARESVQQTPTLKFPAEDGLDLRGGAFSHELLIR